MTWWDREGPGSGVPGNRTVNPRVDADPGVNGLEREAQLEEAFLTHD